MTHARHAHWPLATLVVAGAVVFAACGGGSGPSVESPGPSSTTTASTTPPPSTSTTTPTTATTPTTTALGPTTPAGYQRVAYSGLQFLVPTGWPVYDLANDPTRCVRLDQHAVYLGQEGPAPHCPAQVVGHTDTVQVEPLNARSQTVAGRATQTQTLNGLSVRVDPSAGISGAFTDVFPTQQLVATITFSVSPAVAAQILQSVQRG